MIKRVVFIVEAPFEKRDYDRFGIELLLQNGFHTEIWDATYIVRPQLLENKDIANAFHCDGLTVYKDTRELYNKLLELKKNVFVFNLPSLTYSTLGIYRALGKSHALYAVLMTNALPYFKKPTSLNTIFKRCKNLFPPTFKKIRNKIFLGLPFQWFGIKSAALVLAGGARCFHSGYPIDKKTEILYCHAFDYDLYLKESRANATNQGFAVFLDQYLPLCRDYVFANIKPFISADKYYSLLDNFFNLIKNNLGLDVVIAAHPRSRYEEHPSYFKGYTIIKDRTIKLVRDSKFILAHDSTALNFANLFYKPVIFLTTSELDLTREGAYIREMSKWFGKKPIFMDGNIEIDWKEELRVNRDIYNHYRQSYIKEEGSEELPFWQIVVNRLKKGF